MDDVNKKHLWFPFYLAILVLCCHGCLFGEKKEDKKVVYPIATTVAPPRVPEDEPVENSAKELATRDPAFRTFKVEINERLSEISRETREAQEDLLTRITALEEDYQQLKEKLSLAEFLQEESSNEIKKMREGLEFELGTLREQIEDYNALLVEILNKISSAPEAADQPIPIP